MFTEPSNISWAYNSFTMLQLCQVNWDPKSLALLRHINLFQDCHICISSQRHIHEKRWHLCRIIVRYWHYSPTCYVFEIKPLLSANKTFYECVKKPEVSATKINFWVRRKTLKLCVRIMFDKISPVKTKWLLNGSAM